MISVEQKRCESEFSEGILWNTTLAETTKQEPCPAKQKGRNVDYFYIIYYIFLVQKALLIVSNISFYFVNGIFKRALGQVNKV